MAGGKGHTAREIDIRTINSNEKWGTDMTNDTKKHAVESLFGRAARGEISRRQFTQLSAFVLAGTPLYLRSSGAFAQAKELVLVNWGGDAMTAYDAAYGQPFAKETGIVVKMDGSGPTEGAIEIAGKAFDIADRRSGHARH
jgi:putative spermidine/putrescine transport system substrate-binding protein